MPPEEVHQTQEGSPPGPPITSKIKTVYLIRHAHSMENQRIASMFSCWGDIARCSLPKKSDLGATFELLNISANADAPISELGHQQCAAMKSILNKNKFLAAEKVELVAHSPLERAKETCLELLDCSSDQVLGEEPPEEPAEEVIAFTSEATNDSDSRSITPEQKGESLAATKSSEAEKIKALPEPLKRVVNLPMLTEKTHLEWVPGNAGRFERRVVDFQNWLAEQPESVICLVGHSQFFKLLLGLPFKFENCDVYKVTFDAHKTKPNVPVILEHDGTADECILKPQWYDLVKLYSCDQQPAQPASLDVNNEDLSETKDQDASESSL